VAARDHHPIVRNVPNFLTVLRLCVVPLFVVLFIENEGTSLLLGLLFMGAAFTDFLDGQIARRLGVMSQFGKVADPLADRFLVNLAVLLLVIYDERMIGHDHVPGLEFGIIVARDLVALIAYQRTKTSVLPDVSMLGKWGMFLMMSGLAWLLVLPEAEWPLWAFWPGLAISVVVMVQYLWRYRWAFRRGADVYSDGPPLPAGESSAGGEESRGSTS